MLLSVYTCNLYLGFSLTFYISSLHLIKVYIIDLRSAQILIPCDYMYAVNAHTT